MDKNQLIKGLDYIGLAVCFFCHDGKGNFLMHKRGAAARDERGTWDIGAGSIEFGDTAEQTLRKEIKEEYGTEVLSFEPLGFRDDIHRKTAEGQLLHWLTLDFKVLVNPELAKNNEPHKFDEVKWVTLDNLPTPLHANLPLFLKKYQTKLGHAD